MVAITEGGDMIQRNGDAVEGKALCKVVYELGYWLYVMNT